MLKFVVTRKKDDQSNSSSNVPSKIDINNNINNNSQHVDSHTNERTTQRSKKKKRIAETRQAIILRHKNHRSISLGGSIRGDSEDEEGGNSCYVWSSCSTPRLVNRWNNPPTDLDDDDDDEKDLPQFQRYFRAAGQQNSDDQKPSNPITILIDRCSELSDSNLTLNGKHASFSSFDTCLSSTASSIDPTESPCSSSVISMTKSYNNVQLELRKRKSCKKFGFTVVGGVDSPKGAMGIFVGSIHGDGLAAGMLQKGDELTSVNDKKLKGLSHNEAVKVIKSSGREGCLKLTLRRQKTSNKSRRDSYDEGIATSNSSPNNDNNSNMSAITLRLNQLATNLRVEDPPLLSSSSSSNFNFLRYDRSDVTLTNASCNFKDYDDDGGDGNDTLVHSPNDSKTNDVYTARYKNNKIITIDDNTITIADNNDDNDDNNKNKNINNNNNNNNKSLTRLMTRAAYDFGEKYNSSVLDRLRLEKVFIFDC